MINDDIYMHRCLHLAQMGAGVVAPNPMVGAVLVFNNRIIGEGYHKKFGEPHAEVNCINSVKKKDQNFISKATLYVSLEPCAHYGKTPPCTDLIIQHKIPKVVIGCRDPFIQVDGRGIQKLHDADVHVVVNVLEQECLEINKRFFVFYTQHRPFVILKWAKTANGRIASADTKRLYITGDVTNRLVHKWRGEEASILAGTNTILLDNPELTSRLWPGPSPIRLILDMDLEVPASHKIFNREVKTVIFNTKKHQDNENILFYQVTNDVSIVQQVINALYQLKIQSVLVEGGARLLQSFVDEGMWDEARIITNNKLRIKEGLKAPELKYEQKIGEENYFSDTIEYFKRSKDN
jgi:diaminohydroxyphosphoribosylaminopyrimidine deaminase / 5-amino-6-(5-phosphoribosylamino)uracil reductase